MKSQITTSILSPVWCLKFCLQIYAHTYRQKDFCDRKQMRSWEILTIYSIRFSHRKETFYPIFFPQWSNIFCILLQKSQADSVSNQDHYPLSNQRRQKHPPTTSSLSSPKPLRLLGRCHNIAPGRIVQKE